MKYHDLLRPHPRFREGLVTLPDGREVNVAGKRLQVNWGSYLDEVVATNVQSWLDDGCVTVREGPEGEKFFYSICEEASDTGIPRINGINP